MQSFNIASQGQSLHVFIFRRHNSHEEQPIVQSSQMIKISVANVKACALTHTVTKLTD